MHRKYSQIIELLRDIKLLLIIIVIYQFLQLTWAMIGPAMSQIFLELWRIFQNLPALPGVLV